MSDGPKRFVAVDLETSGLNPQVDDIIEGGLGVEWAVNDPNPQSATFSLQFDEERAQPEALAVNGWGKRHFPPQASYAHAAEVLAEALNDAHLVGKNPW